MQGNMLVGPEVVDAMIDARCGSHPGAPLARRLLAALGAGQEPAATPEASRLPPCSWCPPVGATAACPTSPSTFAATTPPNRSTTSTGWWTLHDLYFGSTPEEELLALDDSLADELRPLLARAGYDSGDGSRDLDDWMGEENFEERWHDGKVDPVVLEQLGRVRGPL